MEGERREGGREGERREGGGCDSLKREERISNGGLTFSGTCNPGRGFVLNGGRGREGGGRGREGEVRKEGV